jgi:hypothetical protein
LPARSIGGDPLLGDFFRYDASSDRVSAMGRLTAMRDLAVSFNPFMLALDQDASSTRALELDALLGDGVGLEALLNRPHASTSISTVFSPGGPTRVMFDNSGKMERFELAAWGIEGSEAVHLALDNVSPRLSMCMDAGPACQRPNPHGVQRYSTTETTHSSMDLDDFGTHGSGSGPAFRTTMNAFIDQGEDTDPIQFTNIRFRNLGLDIQDANGAHISNCGTLPRLSMFVDSRGHPFVINQVAHPGLADSLRLGTDGNPARASNRLSKINGWSSGFLGCLGGTDQSHSGALSCGGQTQVVLRTELGTINAVNLFAFSWNICGGSLTNPQPW